MPVAGPEPSAETAPIEPLVTPEVPGTSKAPAQRGPHRWKKGESGNPTGGSKEVRRALMMLRRRAPAGVKRLLELSEASPDRPDAVCLGAVRSHLEWALGKPKETVEVEGSLRPVFQFINIYRPPGYDPLAQTDAGEAALDAGAIERKAVGL